MFLQGLTEAVLQSNALRLCCFSGDMLYMTMGEAAALEEGVERRNRPPIGLEELKSLAHLKDADPEH